MTEKLDVFIADSLACKTSLSSLAFTDDERQRISLLDSNASCSSHKLNKYLSRKYDAESSKKLLEEKAAAASKLASRLRRMGVKPPPLVLDDPDGAYKTPRPQVSAAMFAVVEHKKESSLSRPQTSMKSRIEDMGAHVDSLALGVGGSDAVGSSGDGSQSGNVTFAVNRLLLKSSQGGRPWSHKDVPLIDSARARIVQMRAQAENLEENSTNHSESKAAPTSSPAMASPSTTAKAQFARTTDAALQDQHAKIKFGGNATRSPSNEAPAMQTPSPSLTSTRHLLRTSKKSSASPGALDVSEEQPVADPVARKKVTAIRAEDVEDMAREVLDTFYARLVGIYRGDCVHFKCLEVASFIDSLKKRRVIITPSGQNDLSLDCSPIANVIPFIPQMRVLEVHDYYINALAAEKLLRSVLQSPQLRLLQFEYCRVSLDCCAAVGLALSRDDSDDSNSYSTETSAKGTAEQKRGSRASLVVFNLPEDASGAGAALQGAASDMAGDAAIVLSQEPVASKVKIQGLDTAVKADESDAGTDGEYDDGKSAAAHLAKVKKIQRLACLEKGLPNLVVLKLSRCNLTGLCVGALCVGLTSNRGVKRLDLSHNSMGDVGCESLGRLLGVSSSLTDVNIGHNHASNHGSLSIARGLLTNSTLQILDLQSNFFGSQETQAAFTESLRRPSNAIARLNVRNCNITAESAVMLAAGMAAAPRLKFVDVSHNMLGTVGSHAFLFAHGIMCTRQRQSDWNQDSLIIAPLLAATGASSPTKGNPSAPKPMPQSDSMFDVADFPGQYQFHLRGAGSYHASVLRWMLHFETMGCACVSSMIESQTTHSGKRSEELDEVLQQLRASAKSLGAWSMPLECVADRHLTVTCHSVFDRVPSAANTLSNAYLHCFDSIISASSAADAVTAVPFVAALLPLHRWVTAADAVSMLSVLVRPSERVSFCAFAVIALVDPTGRDEVVSALSLKEQRLLKESLSKSAAEWTPHNATGHWQLDLGDKVDRRLAHTLCSMLRSAMLVDNQYCADNLGFDVSGLPFMPKVLKPGDLWRNGKIKHKGESSSASDTAASVNSRPSTASASLLTKESTDTDMPELFPSSPHYDLPHSGFLDVDFVCVHQPPPCCKAVDDAVWQQLADSVSEALRMGDFMAMQHELLQMRRRSNSIYIRSGMLHQLLNLFKLPNSRLDLVVMFYRRVTDWIGLQRKLQDWLSFDVFENSVGKRIGFPVAFDDFSLVGYYDLQLTVADNRNLLKRILLQANDSMGLSVVDWVHDGVADDYPKEWGELHAEVPRTSYVTFRVCCSAQLVDAIEKAAKSAIPDDWGTLQPAGLNRYRCCHRNGFSNYHSGSSWLAGHKIALLRERLLGGKRNAGKGVYRTMNQLFDAFDIDRRFTLCCCLLVASHALVTVVIFPLMSSRLGCQSSAYSCILTNSKRFAFA